MTLDKGSMRAPGIVPRITDISATLDFNADGVNLPQSSLKMGKNDLSFHGGIKNFQKPVINLVMESKLFDLDSLLPQKTPEQLKQEEKAQQTESNEMSEAQMAAMVAGPIILMKRNPMMRDMDFTAKVNMKKLVVHKAPIENLQAEMNFKNLTMELRKAVLQTFGGAVGMNALIDFKGNEPKYKASGEVKGLDINAAITNQMPMAKDTLFGKTMGKFSIEGAGVTKTRAKQTLTGSAHMEIQNGSWSSLTAMKTLSEKVSSIPVQSIKDQLGKINITDKFRQLKTDIKIAGGRFNIVSMIADMEGTNTTINGTGWIDFDMNNSIAGQIFTGRL
jgi:hypothetical protein